MYRSCSAPAFIYGTPKMLKFSCNALFPKRRPIVSYIGTFNCNVDRFYCDVLSPLVPNDYSCKNTFSFVCQIKNANLYKKFLNTPIQETIVTAINLIFNHNPNLNITKIELKILSFLLHHRLIFFLTVSFIIKLME